MIKPLLSRLFLYSKLFTSKRVASDASIIGVTMSKERIFANPNAAKKIVIIDKIVVAIFTQLHSFVKFQYVKITFCYLFVLNIL